MSRMQRENDLTVLDRQVTKEVMQTPEGCSLDHRRGFNFNYELYDNLMLERLAVIPPRNNRGVSLKRRHND